MLMLLCVHMTRVLFFSTGGKFRPDYGLLLELHALTLVARSYALLTTITIDHRGHLLTIFLTIYFLQLTLICDSPLSLPCIMSCTMMSCEVK